MELKLLELIRVQKYPRNYTADLINDLVIYYHLNIESVFDYYFGEKFEKWISKN